VILSITHLLPSKQTQLSENMKKLTTIITILASMLIFTACNKPTDNQPPIQIEQPKRETVASNVLTAKVGDFIFDEDGRKYIKITNAGEKNSQGIYREEIWERVEPLDKKHWYAPSLSSVVWTNQPVRFNSLFRMEGEDYPVF